MSALRTARLSGQFASVSVSGLASGETYNPIYVIDPQTLLSVFPQTYFSCAAQTANELAAGSILDNVVPTATGTACTIN